jgi:toxin secretion/phage lysis holin
MWEKITKICMTVGGAIMGIFGQWTPLMTLLIVSMSLDYASGVMVAWKGKSLKTESGFPSSKVGFDGLLKKAGIIIIVLVASLLDKTIGNSAMIFQTAVVCYYIANELLSIIENVGLLGLPVPPAIKKALEALKAKNEDTAEQVTDVVGDVADAQEKE